MSEKKISRRKMLAAVAGTGIAASAGGAGTYAYLSDEKSVNSLFEVGSLTVSVTPEELDFKDLNEKQESKTAVEICNMGTLPVRQVLLTDVVLDGSTELAKALEVTKVTFEGKGIGGYLHNGDQNGNERVDLHDVSEYLKEADAFLHAEHEEDIVLETDDKEGSESDCKEFVLTTKMHYEDLNNIQGEEKHGLTATLDIMAKQNTPNL